MTDHVAEAAEIRLPTSMESWNPWTSDQLPGRRVGDFWDRFWDLARQVGTGYIPHGSLTESSEHFTLELDLPGVARGNITVDASDRRLTVTGHRAEGHEDGTSVRHSTRYAGTFSYEAVLPAAVDETKATAELKDGVLRVRLPKSGRSVRHQIPVR